MILVDLLLGVKLLFHLLLLIKLLGGLSELVELLDFLFFGVSIELVELLEIFRHVVSIYIVFFVQPFTSLRRQLFYLGLLKRALGVQEKVPKWHETKEDQQFDEFVSAVFLIDPLQLKIKVFWFREDVCIAIDSVANALLICLSLGDLEPGGWRWFEATNWAVLFAWQLDFGKFLRLHVRAEGSSDLPNSMARSIMCASKHFFILIYLVV